MDRLLENDDCVPFTSALWARQHIVQHRDQHIWPSVSSHAMKHNPEVPIVTPLQQATISLHVPFHRHLYIE